MNKFKIKPLKGFSLIELLVSIVIIAAITMLISSAFIGMMAQKKSLQVRETAEDMTREIISTVTRNRNNLDLLLKIIKSRTLVPSTGPGSQFQPNQQFAYQMYEYDEAANKRNFGYRVDLTKLLDLDGKDTSSLSNIQESWLKLDATATEDLTIASAASGPDSVFETPGVQAHPFRFFKELLIAPPPPPATQPTMPDNQKMRKGIFSVIDLASLNMKMKILPKNTKDPNTGTVISWNTKVFLNIASISGKEPQNAADFENRKLRLSAEVRYSIRNVGDLETNFDKASEVLTQKDFNPTIVETDTACLQSSKPASCPECRSTNGFAPGCDKCKTYNMTTGLEEPRTGSQTNPIDGTTFNCP